MPTTMSLGRGRDQRVPRAAERGAVSWDHLRFLAFGMLMTLLWLVPNPNAASFRDDPTAGREGTAFIQVLWIAVLVFALFVSVDRWSAIRKQFDVTIIALVAWCSLTAAFALVPDVSARRLIFTLTSMMIMCLTISGVRRMEAILWMLLGFCVIETLAKYFIVFEFPSFGKHLATGAEPQLAGLWKGQYAHKNAAGPVCAIELMILYAARRHISLLVLSPLIAAELVFLFESGSKTPLALLVFMMFLAKLLLRLRSGLAVSALVLIGLAALNLLTLASVVSDDARLITEKLVGDASFTGRVEVWRFLIKYSQDAPLMGAGFQSFWQIGNLSPAVAEGGNWVVSAVYGHQGFLDTIVMIGYPGLVLLLAFAVLRPAFDLARVRDKRSTMLEMFVTFWLFGLFTNGTESVFLGRADGTWLFLIAGVIGIRRFAFGDDERPPARRAPVVPIAPGSGPFWPALASPAGSPATQRRTPIPP